MFKEFFIWISPVSLHQFSSIKGFHVQVHKRTHNMDFNFTMQLYYLKDIKKLSEDEYNYTCLTKKYG